MNLDPPKPAPLCGPETKHIQQMVLRNIQVSLLDRRFDVRVAGNGTVLLALGTHSEGAKSFRSFTSRSACTWPCYVEAPWM